MEKEISVVEWLYGKWSEQGTLYLEDLEQANKMFEEQIMNAYWQGDAESDNINVDAEDYYNKTFKSE